MPSMSACPGVFFQHYTGSTSSSILSAQDYLDCCEDQPDGISRLKAEYLPRVGEEFNRARLLSCFELYLDKQVQNGRKNLGKKQAIYQKLCIASEEKLLYVLTQSAEKLRGIAFISVGETVLDAWKDCLRRSQAKQNAAESREMVSLHRASGLG